jgi:hypothetical protein
MRILTFLLSHPAKALPAGWLDFLVSSPKNKKTGEYIMAESPAINSSAMPAGHTNEVPFAPHPRLPP